MKNSFTYSSFAIFIGFLVLSCDSTVSPTDKLQTAPAINSLSISPQEINFSPSDGFKDTTLTLQIEAIIENVDSESNLGFVIRGKITSNLIIDGNLIPENGTTIFSADAIIETTTTSFEDYIVEVYAYNQAGNGNFFQKTLTIEGFSNNRPEITGTSSPNIITRPSSGSIPAVFTATVTDADGDHTIDRVFLRVLDQTAGEVTGSPFDMADDGVSLRDTTANDFTYTWSLDVPGNPDSGIINRDYDIEFYALDQGGLYSDTVRTTFSIRGN